MMSTPSYYRGGNSLRPRRLEVKFDRVTGLVKPEPGVSMSTRPDGLERFGGAFTLGAIPSELQIIQVGRDPNHHEIVPVAPMTMDRYTELLEQIELISV